MKQSLFLILAFTFTSPLLSGCYKSQEKPALANGECDINARGFASNSSANTAMQRVSAILNNRSIGNADLRVIRQDTYVSMTRGKNADEWGYQIVYSCGDLSLHSEYEKFITRSQRDAAYTSRKATLESLTDGTKVINSSAGYFDFDCTKKYDSSGHLISEECDTGYDYSIQWVKIINSEFQKQVLTAYNLYTGIATTLGLREPTLNDVLETAKKALPASSDGHIAAEQLSDLLNQIDSINQQ